MMSNSSFPPGGVREKQYFKCGVPRSQLLLEYPGAARVLLLSLADLPTMQGIHSSGAKDSQVELSAAKCRLYFSIDTFSTFSLH